MWNGVVEKSELLRQLRAFAEQHVYEVMIMPGSGLEPAYLSPGYFDLVRYAVEQAGQLNMGVWLYDEYNWPSGAAATEVFYRNPAYGMRFLRCYQRRVVSVDPRALSVTYEDGEIVLAGVYQHGRLTDLREQVSACPAIPVTQRMAYWQTEVESATAFREGVVMLPPGEGILLIAVATCTRVLLANAIGSSWSHELPGYVDTLNPDAIAEFIRLTHEGYKAAVGPYFGNVIRGIFTDEPSMMRQHGCPIEGWSAVKDLPWTAELPTLFARETGSPLLPVLPKLILSAEPSDELAALRRDFRRVLTHRYIKAYHQQISAWCVANHLAYAGHVLCDKNPAGWLDNQGDYPEVLRAFHVPAMDYCFAQPQLSNNRPFGWELMEYVTAKVVAGVAFHEHRERACSETFALCGYASGLRDYQRTTAFLGALGINMTLCSAAPYSLGLNRRRLVPTAHSFHAPNWRYYALYADFVTRLSRWLAQSRHAADCALLFPSSDWLAAADSAGKGRILSVIVRDLLSRQIDFDFVTETHLVGARPRAKGVRLGRGVYRTLIVPPLDALSAASREQLHLLSRHGLHIIWCDAGECLQPLREIAPTVICDFPPEIAQHIVVNKRWHAGHDWYLIAFFGDQHSQGAFCLPGVTPPRVYDLETGRTQPLSYQSEVDAIRIPVCLYPYQTLAIQLDGPAKRAPVTLAPKYRELLALSGPWEFALQRRNADHLANWHVWEGGAWRPAVAERLLLDYSGQYAWQIRAEFTIAELPDHLALAFEHEIISELTINGNLLPIGAPSDYFDATTSEVDITPFIRMGVNTVAATMRIAEHQRRNDSYAKTTLPPVFLLGTFVATGGKICRLPARLPEGDWCLRGLARFSGSLTYSLPFVASGEMLALDKQQALAVKADVYGGVMEVACNGKPLGVRAWDPYRLSLARQLRPGNNKLTITVTNALSNFIDYPAPSGLRHVVLETAHPK